MKKLWNIFLLLFSKSAFAKAENKFSGIEINDAEERICKKQSGYYTSFIYVLSALGLGYLTAHYLKINCNITESAILLLRAVSILIIAWAALSRIGAETESGKGKTLLEITSRDSFKFFYILGVYLITVALFINGN